MRFHERTLEPRTRSPLVLVRGARRRSRPRGIRLHPTKRADRRDRGDRPRRGRLVGPGGRRAGRPQRQGGHRHDHGNLRPAHERRQLGLLQGRRVQRQRRQRRRPRPGRERREADPRRPRRRPHPAVRCGRHDPGHAARLLLRHRRARHRDGRHPPDGRADERPRLRRRRARQSRVQLRARFPRPLDLAARRPRTRGERGPCGHEGAAIPAVHDHDAEGAGPPADQDRRARAHQPGRRHLGQGERRGSRRSAGVSSKRPPAGCPSCAPRVPISSS